MRVKICGITREEDIDFVNEFNPEYVGFVFAQSKRRVSIEKALILINKLNSNIKKVGVFVDEEIEKIRVISELLELDAIQLHGLEDNEYISELRRNSTKTIWKAISVNTKEDIVKINESTADIVLLDNGKGGTGKTFDWNLAENIEKSKAFILAGGINADNLREACLKIKPFAVDVSSGVEVGGIKNYLKIKEFMNISKSI